MTTRRQRAHDTERIVARWFAENGWPHAEPVGAGRAGSDVTGMPGLCVEVKARRALDLTGWLRQHARDVPQILNGQGETIRGGLSLPFVAFRPDGYGPEKIASWPVLMRLDDFTALLKQAGYGG